MPIDNTGPWTTFTPHNTTDVEYEYVFVQAPYEAAVAWFEAAFGRNPLAAVYQGDSTEYVAPAQSHEDFEDARRITSGEVEAAAIGRSTSRSLSAREIGVDEDCLVVEHTTFEDTQEERDGYTNPQKRVVLDGQGRPVFGDNAHDVSVTRPQVGEEGEIERTTVKPEKGAPPTTQNDSDVENAESENVDEVQEAEDMTPELQTVSRELLENMSYRDLQQAAGDFESISGTLSKDEFVESFSDMGLARFSEAVENTDAEFPSTDVVKAP
jgi:hypothetical protein